MEASAAVGCDGVKNYLRKGVLGGEAPAVHPAFTGKYACRGLIEIGKAVELLGDELSRNAAMWTGSHGHVLTFPIEKADTMNVITFQSKENRKWEDEKWVLRMERAKVENDFEKWEDSVRKIPSLMEKLDIWALFGVCAVEFASEFGSTFGDLEKAFEVFDSLRGPREGEAEGI